MPRFEMNRSWTLIPALGLCLTLLVGGASELRAQTRDYYDDPVMGGGGNAPPAAVGDPDSPGATKNGGGQGRAGVSRLNASTKRAVGDGRVGRSDWKWRLQVVLQAGRKLNIRF